MKFIKTEKRYLYQKIKECESLIKYSNELKKNELRVNLDGYKKHIQELKKESKIK